VARVIEERFDSLDTAPVLIGSDETPVPFAKVLEQASMPTPEGIADAVRTILGVGDVQSAR
jgi:pyruvate dehydrogenase E1 component beta subunit